MKVDVTVQVEIDTNSKRDAEVASRKFIEAAVQNVPTPYIENNDVCSAPEIIDAAAIEEDDN